MKNKQLIILVLVASLPVLYVLKNGYCLLFESCGKTNYVEHIKSVVLPLKKHIEKFHINHKRYPEWDEIKYLLELSGCKSLKLIRKERVINSDYTGKPMIDTNGKSFMSYKYSCMVHN